jgi:hypothetical protein
LLNEKGIDELSVPGQQRMTAKTLLPEVFQHLLPIAQFQSHQIA